MFYKALSTIAIEDWEPAGVSEYSDHSKLLLSLRNGDGILLFDCDTDLKTAAIRALGRVEEVNEPDQIVKITWKKADFILRPGSHGFRHWRDRPCCRAPRLNHPKVM